MNNLNDQQKNSNSDQSKSIAWSMYWAQDQLHSCVAADADIDQERVNSIWQEFARSLAENAKVLDLATGNGAVPAAMLSARPNLAFEAVDLADVDPNQFLSDHPEFESVTFHANTDINTLSLATQEFDAVTSQFGIEYADLTVASLAALAYLKPNGSLLFLIHHKDSEIIQAARKKVDEMQQLVKVDGLLDTLLAVLRGEVQLDQLEQLGQAYLSTEHIRTQQISGQIFSGIEQVLKSMGSSPQKARELGVTLNLRLRCECQRLEQMLNAAKSKSEMRKYQELLQDHGLVILELESIYADSENSDYLLAWLIKGRLD